MRLLPVLPLLLVLAACKTADSNVGAGGEGEGIDSCDTDSRAMTYSAGMTAAAKSKAFQIVLVDSKPAPPARGNNTWTIKVLDANGAAVDAPTLTVSPFMPDHGHGTSVSASITANADGTFNVTPLYLFMGGIWQITFGIQAGGVTDSVVLSFCIQG